MSTTPKPSRFWINWLLFASAAVAVFGLMLVVAPAVAQQGFSLLVYSSPRYMDAFGQEPLRYIWLVHAVIGGVLIGWGVAMFSVTKTFLARGEPTAWKLLVFSLGAWFVPDSLYSVLSGYWQNALLNTGFLAVFALPLWATRRLLKTPV